MITRSLKMHVSNNCMLGPCISSLPFLPFFFPPLSPTPVVNPLFPVHQAHSEEISQERNERQRLERDLEEASRRLAMAHQDIRRLTNELDAAKNNNPDPSGMLQLQYGPKFLPCTHILLTFPVFKISITVALMSSPNEMSVTCYLYP